jgi:hypothetical protein
MVSLNKVAALSFAAILTAVLIAVQLSGTTDVDLQMKTVVLEVIHGGAFNVTVSSNGEETFFSGYGRMRKDLISVIGEEWNFSASVTKLGGGDAVLYVYIKTVDGKVLASDSTSEPMGTATISLTL